MNVYWVISQITEPGFIDPQVIRNVGPAWGSWKLWRDYKVDNSICTELDEAKDLQTRAFHAVSNLYVPKSYYADLGRPTGLKFFDGEFQGPVNKNRDDIVALNIAAPGADIVLLAGFDLSILPENASKIEAAIENTYQRNVKSVIESNPDVQFVLVNYPHSLSENFKDISNLTQDSLESVIDLLV